MFGKVEDDELAKTKPVKSIKKIGKDLYEKLAKTDVKDVIKAAVQKMKESKIATVFAEAFKERTYDEFEDDYYDEDEEELDNEEEYDDNEELDMDFDYVDEEDVTSRKTR